MDPKIVASLVNPKGLPRYSGPTGAVEGTITVIGPRAPQTPGTFTRCPLGERDYATAFREGPDTSDHGARWLADAVVAITGYSEFYIENTVPSRIVVIQDCSFQQRTITATFGQSLEIRNQTKEFWTPVLTPSQTAVMRMLPPNGEPIRFYPKQPGRYRLSDFDRTFVTADTFVFLHPLHTTSSVGGSFRIQGVPTGKLTISTMHPALGEAQASASIEVRENETTRVSLQLTHRPREERDAGPSGTRLH